MQSSNQLSEYFFLAILVIGLSYFVLFGVWFANFFVLVNENYACRRVYGSEMSLLLTLCILKVNRYIGCWKFCKFAGFQCQMNHALRDLPEKIINYLFASRNIRSESQLRVYLLLLQLKINIFFFISHSRIVFRLRTPLFFLVLWK